MKIGILIALDEEAKSLISNFKLIQKIKTTCYEVFEYEFNNHQLFFLSTGVGEINASSSAQFLITKFGVELIINYGVCGLLNSEIKSTLMLVNKVCHYDIDTSLIDTIEKGRYFYFDSVYIPVYFYKINDLSKKLNLENVICASGDTFVAEESFKNELIKNYSADICEMELAGIALVCEKNKIPLISLKAVSDNASSSEYNDEKVLALSEILFNKFVDILRLI